MLQIRKAMNYSPAFRYLLFPSLLLLAACRKTTVEKPAESGAHDPAEQHVSQNPTASTEPFTGKLVLSPEFQWLGAGGDGGGILRATLSVAAMMSDDPETARKLAEAADQAPPRAEPKDFDLSGISDWIARTEDLPPVDKASQKRRFGPWEVHVWGRGIGDATMALHRSGELQFAWQGYGFATTGPLLPEKAEEEAYSPFEGPPAGTDLDADGVPDLLVYDYSGGAHCCTTVKHIVCSVPPALTAQISGWHADPEYKDLDSDGKFEMHIRDTSYAYWNACYAASPSPKVVFRVENGRYHIAGELMRQQGRTSTDTANRLKEFTHRLSRLDLVLARYRDRSKPKRVLSAEEEADDDFFGGEGWHKGDVHLPSDVWAFLLDLIYSGRVKEAAQALDTMWPPGKPYQQDFAGDLYGMIAASPYGPLLPWFGEIKSAFHVSGDR
jgi:hypothetical protein